MAQTVSAPLQGYSSTHRSDAACRYADKLEAAHDGEHLAKFEELLEAAVDLDRIPDEYLICASYDADLQVFIPKPYRHCSLLLYQSPLVQRKEQGASWEEMAAADNLHSGI